jgi:hypothetical protein
VVHFGMFPPDFSYNPLSFVFHFRSLWTPSSTMGAGPRPARDADADVVHARRKLSSSCRRLRVMNPLLHGHIQWQRGIIDLHK